MTARPVPKNRHLAEYPAHRSAPERGQPLARYNVLGSAVAGAGVLAIFLMDRVQRMVSRRLERLEAETAVDETGLSTAAAGNGSPAPAAR